jgi:hypothetical protein
VSTRPANDTALVLPHSIEGERAVLGSILLDVSALSVAADVERLQPDHFFLRQNFHVYRNMLDLRAKNVPVDIVTVLDSLERSGDLETAGGAAYVSGLPDGLPRVNNVAHYARIVKQKAVLRSLIHYTSSIQEQAFAASDDADVILDGFDAVLQQLRKACHSNVWQQKFHLVDELPDGGVVHLIENILPEGVGFVGGLSGTGKTWFCLSMARGLTTGQKFLGLWSVPELQNVLYLCPEMGAKSFKRRCRRMGIGGERFRCQTIADGAALDLADPILLAAVRELHPVIFLDTSIRFSDAENENSAGENRALVRTIFALLRTGAKAVICLHHRGKDAARSKADELTLENTLRGTTDLGAIADVVFGLKYDQLDGGHSPYLKESKKLVRLQVSCVKARDFIAVESFRIQLNPFLDEHGDFAVLVDQPQHALPDVDRLIAAIEDNRKVTKVKLQELTGIGRNKISKLAATAGWHYKPLTGWTNG